MIKQATVDWELRISKALSIPGWMSKEELLWLASNASECEFIVEFGSYHGRSTRALADSIKPNGKIWAVDPWNGEYYLDYTNTRLELVNTYVFPLFKRNLHDHIQAGRVEAVRGRSYNFNPPHLVDMVFIDGDHRAEVVGRDINKALSILKPGGIICGHDYNHPVWPEVKELVDNLLGKVQVSETIWHTRKS